MTNQPTRAELLEALKVCERVTPRHIPTRVLPVINPDGWWHCDHGGGEDTAEPRGDIIARYAPNRKGDAEFDQAARTLLPRCIRALLERAEDTELIDGAADMRIVDGIGGIDIDEETLAALPTYEGNLPAASEGEWAEETCR